MRKLLTAVVAVAAVGLSAGTMHSASAEPVPRPLAAGDFDFSAPQTLATNLAVPWGLAFLPDGSALVSERSTARVLRVTAAGTVTPLFTLPGVVVDFEDGLLGLAVSPDYATDGYVYAFYKSSTDDRIVRFQLDSPDVQEPILTGLSTAPMHNGGRIAFGPDGKLYAGVGDATVSANAQNMASNNGKILRINPDGTVPADNPFANSLVYSLGHRNVQGLAWDAQGRLFATEFGQNTWDEINRITPGANYGWPTVEGTSTDTRFTNPVIQWRPAEASPSGAAIVGGNLFVAALRGTRLWQVPVTAAGALGTPVAQLLGTYGRLRTVAVAPDGYLWVMTSMRDGKLTAGPDDDRILRFPPVA
jgi:glucose/arabinose dehydrogenase